MPHSKYSCLFEADGCIIVVGETKDGKKECVILRPELSDPILISDAFDPADGWDRGDSGEDIGGSQ